MPTTYVRRPLRTTAVGLAMILISALLVLATPWHPATAHALVAAPSGKDPAKFAKRVRYLINQERIKHGVGKVRGGSCIHNYATHWGNHLAADNAWYHSDLYNLLGKCNMHAAAENLVFYPDGMTPRQVVKLWMNSAGHRENLLNGTYKRTGLYFVWDADQGMWYGVQEFGLH